MKPFAYICISFLALASLGPNALLAQKPDSPSANDLILKAETLLSANEFEASRNTLLDAKTACQDRPCKKKVQRLLKQVALRLKEAKKVRKTEAIKMAVYAGPGSKKVSADEIYKKYSVSTEDGKWASIHGARYDAAMLRDYYRLSSAPEALALLDDSRRLRKSANLCLLGLPVAGGAIGALSAQLTDPTGQNVTLGGAVIGILAGALLAPIPFFYLRSKGSDKFSESGDVFNRELKEKIELKPNLDHSSYGVKLEWAF